MATTSGTCGIEWHWPSLLSQITILDLMNGVYSNGELPPDYTYIDKVCLV
jgi:hypothetical protein